MGSSRDLADLYIRLLGKLGTEYVGDLAKELEGIGQLFKWNRISQAAKPVDDILEREGFGRIDLRGPGDVSDGFRLELEEKWTPAFLRFEALVARTADQLKQKATTDARSTAERKETSKEVNRHGRTFGY